MKLCYLANARIPTSKAYGLQIFQNCEAFARNGATVTLYVPHRGNTAKMRRITDPWAHYGVAREFPIHRVRCFDVHRSIRRLAGPLASHIRSIAYGIALVPLMAITRADVYYARDPTTLLTLSLFKSRHTLAYEVHQLAQPPQQREPGDEHLHHRSRELRKLQHLRRHSENGAARYQVQVLKV